MWSNTNICNESNSLEPSINSESSNLIDPFETEETMLKTIQCESDSALPLVPSFTEPTENNDTPNTNDPLTNAKKYCSADVDLSMCTLNNDNMETKCNTKKKTINKICSFCNKNVVDKVIQCTTCSSWCHNECTKLLAYQIYIFKTTTRNYTCEHCANVPDNWRNQ